MVRAFARVDHASSTIADAIEEAAKGRPKDFNFHTLASMAWSLPLPATVRAFATVEYVTTAC